MNYRAARAREEVSVSRTALDIRKTAPSGKSQDYRFNPFWAKFAGRAMMKSASRKWRWKARADACRSAVSSIRTIGRVSPRPSRKRW
jgi:uncharacterized membrane protein